MFKVEDYRKHAQECRQMLSRARSDDERQMLEQMVMTWEALATAREDQIARQARINELEIAKGK